MEITKTVPVTIEINGDDLSRCGECKYWMDRDDQEGNPRHECGLFNESVCTYRRCPACLAEFGTGEKPAVVPWAESKIGDVVEVNGIICRAVSVSVHAGCKCRACCLHNKLCANELGDLLCETHPSGRDVYFTEVE